MLPAGGQELPDTAACRKCDPDGSFTSALHSRARQLETQLSELVLTEYTITLYVFTADLGFTNACGGVVL
ncbi:hypothetical protein D9M69_495810 [compost metagenome]